jgi:taurine-pyruvate aminotransferase
LQTIEAEVEERAYTDVGEADIDTLWRPLTQHALRKKPLVIIEGRGCTVVDAEGNEYLDAISGLWCVNVGYGQERLVEAAVGQMRRLAFTPLTRPAPVSLELASRLRRILPGNLNHVHFASSGSEATETALKIARQFARQRYPGQRRTKVIARYRSYHGWTFGANSASGQVGRKVAFEPMMPGFLHVRPPDMFRLFGGVSPSDAARELACELDYVIESEGPETVAAFIGEPIIGGGGVIVPPDEYWPLIREVCDKYGVLLIHDEVITGFGRTGTMFGGEHWGVVPDIITMAKGMSSGYLPIAAVGVTDEVFDAFLGDAADNVQFTQITTFGGHPVACAVALENLELIVALRLVENAAAMGARLLTGAAALQQRHDIIGDVRGKGLMCAIELVEPGTHEPLPAAVIDQLVQEAQARGVLLGRSAGNVLRLESLIMIAPPLIASADEIDRILNVIDDALQTIHT